MNREEITAFLASLKKLRDGLDDFNYQLAGIDGAGVLEADKTAPPADLPEERKVIIFGDLSKRPQHECITLLLPYDLLPLIKVKNQLKNFALYQRFARFAAAPFFLWREDNLKRFLKPDHWRCGNYKAGVKLRLRRIRCRLRRFASNECGHQSAREEK